MCPSPIVNSFEFSTINYSIVILCRLQYRSGLNLFQLGQFFQNLAGMAGDLRFNVRKDPAELPLWINNVGLPVRKGSKSRNTKGASIFLRDLSPLVAQHEEVELFLCAELGVLFHGIDADTDDLGIELAIGFQITLKASGL